MDGRKSNGRRRVGNVIQIWQSQRGGGDCRNDSVERRQSDCVVNSPLLRTKKKRLIFNFNTMEQTALSVALRKLLIVFLYAGASAVIPAITAYLSSDVRFLAFVPVINAVWAAAVAFLKQRKIIAAGKQR